MKSGSDFCEYSRKNENNSGYCASIFGCFKSNPKRQTNKNDMHKKDSSSSESVNSAEEMQHVLEDRRMRRFNRIKSKIFRNRLQESIEESSGSDSSSDEDNGGSFGESSITIPVSEKLNSNERRKLQALDTISSGSSSEMDSNYQLKSFHIRNQSNVSRRVSKRNQHENKRVYKKVTKELNHSNSPPYDGGIDDSSALNSSFIYSTTKSGLRGQNGKRVNADPENRYKNKKIIQQRELDVVFEQNKKTNEVYNTSESDQYFQLSPETDDRHSHKTKLFGRVSRGVNPLDSQDEMRERVEFPRILSPSMRNMQNNKPRNISGYSRKRHVLKRHLLDEE
ncbi:unnamed protein product [Moneuplotes crassus]|uniref:Uncharacterized protein n=1 Tax=Euplotes crassus TaxID=5936 RepID=A0AAD2D800_EUPCR|nr:unnamed protein product [Moneuplotes crassus]